MKENNTGSKTPEAKKEFFLFRWFRRLFFPQKELDIYAEEQVQSPLRVVVRNFFSKKTGLFAVIVFAVIALFVLITPIFVVFNPAEQDSTAIYVAPGLNMLSAPSELSRVGAADISVGSNYSVACDKNGKVYVWGQTKVTRSVNLKYIPDEVRDAKIVQVAAGYDHCYALDDQGTLYGWGNGFLDQLELPGALDSNNRLHNKKIVKIDASYQFTAALTEEGEFYIWGNKNNADLTYRKSELDGHVKDFALSIDSYILLLDSGEVTYGNFNPQMAITKIPETVSSGVVRIAATAQTAAAVKEDGSVVVWGSAVMGEKNVPALSSKIVSIAGGRYHYVAALEDGSVVTWGDSHKKQTVLPKSISKLKAAEVYAGANQSYAIDGNGKVEKWGFKGYLLGTDALGRDVFTRLVNGGKMTMTIGAVAVIIEMIIGIILGGLAGYFGGVVDMAIMRIAEIVSSIPFLPLAMILSSILNARMSPDISQTQATNQRMYLIMIILGVLSWPGLCRLIRAQIFAQREMEYVTAAKALGVKESKIIFSHIIPNVMSVCLVSITLAFGTSMLTESSLSYLGFGVPSWIPTWGNMLNGANNSTVIQNYWWNWVFVGAIFGVTCICINLIGDALRDALDPKANSR
ncbi:MAG: ABC transporter permease subunit [Ruminococcaceae bacterium]|jgi:peptide/nickel transport system permease protein|nr:ABC transporter permease subunit [Oscillospiraceae bacterium]